MKTTFLKAAVDFINTQGLLFNNQFEIRLDIGFNLGYHADLDAYSVNIGKIDNPSIQVILRVDPQADKSSYTLTIVSDDLVSKASIKQEDISDFIKKAKVTIGVKKIYIYFLDKLVVLTDEKD